MLDEAEQYLGEAMTYTLFESVREHMASFTEDQPLAIVDNFVSETMAEVSQFYYIFQLCLNLVN